MTKSIADIVRIVRGDLNDELDIVTDTWLMLPKKEQTMEFLEQLIVVSLRQRLKRFIDHLNLPKE